MQQEKDTTNIENVINHVNEESQESINYRFSTDIDKELHDAVVFILNKRSIPRVSPIRKLFENIKQGGEAYLKNFMFSEPSDLSIKSQLTNTNDGNRQTDNPTF